VPFGKRRKEFAEGEGSPEPSERAASESTGQGEGILFLFENFYQRHLTPTLSPNCVGGEGENTK